MSRLIRMVLAAGLFALAMQLTQLSVYTESPHGATGAVIGAWACLLVAVQLIVSSARAADEALLRRYVAYRDELDRAADGRTES